MKAIALILTFLVLVLNSLPCCSFDDCAEESASEQRGHEEEQEACSPFLTCGTCTGFVVLEEIPEVNIYSLAVTTEVFESQDSFYSKYTSRIWQPPQYY